jgi:hypothetical protein
MIARNVAKISLAEGIISVSRFFEGSSYISYEWKISTWREKDLGIVKGKLVLEGAERLWGQSTAFGWLVGWSHYFMVFEDIPIVQHLLYV